MLDDRARCYSRDWIAILNCNGIFLFWQIGPVTPSLVAPVSAELAARASWVSSAAQTSWASSTASAIRASQASTASASAYRRHRRHRRQRRRRCGRHRRQRRGRRWRCRRHRLQRRRFGNDLRREVEHCGIACIAHAPPEVGRQAEGGKSIERAGAAAGGCQNGVAALVARAWRLNIPLIVLLGYRFHFGRMV